MNGEHLQAAAKAMIAHEPELGRLFTMQQIADRLRALAAALKLEGIVTSQID